MSKLIVKCKIMFDWDNAVHWVGHLPLIAEWNQHIVGFGDINSPGVVHAVRLINITDLGRFNDAVNETATKRCLFNNPPTINNNGVQPPTDGRFHSIITAIRATNCPAPHR